MAGLAESMAPQQMQQQPQASAGMPSIEEIIALLMQGTPPEELEQMGIPPELIMEAINMIEQQMAAEQQQAPQQAPQQQMGGGLAQQMAGQ